MSAEEYLAQQPPERRAALSAVRDVIRGNLPDGYEEGVQKGMLVYYVPLSRYQDTYNKQPLWLAALVAQKNYNSLHMMSVYGSKAHEQRLRDGFAKADKRLDMGKACIHFRAANDLPLSVIGELIASMPVDKWIAIAKAAHQKPAKRANA
jgi:hypothetical protein